MTTLVPPITLADLTTASTSGTGVFDVLMRANKAHLEQEFLAGRIKGAEYATVYLGSLQAVMTAAVEFLLQKDKTALEAQLVEQQILLAQVEVTKAEAQVEQVRAQTLNLAAELLLLEANQEKIPAEIAQLTAQTALTNQQKVNAVAEGANIPKQGALIEAQTSKVQKDVLLADAELGIKQEQILVAKAEVLIADAKLTNIPKEGAVLDAQSMEIAAKTGLTNQQKLNLIAEAVNIPKQGAVLDGQKCKLDAEFDLLKTTDLKTAEETQLLLWKTNTEKAQTTGAGVDANSVVGKQMALYGAQTDGFKRDAEQKAAKLLADTWSVRRTTDEGTVADVTNRLDDATIGRAIEKLLNGIGA